MRKIIPLIFLWVILTSCSSQTEVDKSFLTGIPCAPPCWHGLIVSESNEDDVKTVLSKLAFIEQNSINSSYKLLPSINPHIYKSGVEIYANCLHKDINCLSLRVVDDVLLEINIHINYELKLSEAISHLGHPDFIGYEDASTEKISCQILGVWIKNQIILKSKRFEGINNYEKQCESINLSNSIMDISISEVSYLTLTRIESLLISDSHYFEKFSKIQFQDN